MFRRQSRIYFVYILIDITFIGLSFYWPFKSNPDLIPQDYQGIRAYLATYFLWGSALILLLQNACLYYTDRYLSISGEWLVVTRCVLYASVLGVLAIFILKINIFSRLIFIESTLSLLASLSAWRTLKRLYVRYLIQKGYANHNALIVGAGNTGMVLAEEIKAFPFLGIKTVGFIDDSKTGEVNGSQILGRTEDIEKIVNKYFVDEVYVTIPSQRKITGEIIQRATKLGRTVRVLAEHYNMPYRQVSLNYIGTMPLITYFEKTQLSSESVAKRLMDIVIAGSALILLSPLFAIVALLIKAESPGPVFYVAKRSGKKGSAFYFYKFRSMIRDAETHKEKLRSKSEVDGPIFKIRNDPRLTAMGRFLRRYSIDEFPQLINVIKGDMSLVGPRPFPVEESEKFEYGHIPRLDIRPGMTGLAQVKGRSDLKFNNCVRWDMWYIENWSIWLDIRILFWTIPVVLKGKGAY